MVWDCGRNRGIKELTGRGLILDCGQVIRSFAQFRWQNKAPKAHACFFEKILGVFCYIYYIVLIYRVWLVELY